MSNTNDVPCPLEVRQDMDLVLSYGWQSERRDYELNGDENHVFLAMRRVNDWLMTMPPVGPDYVHVVETFSGTGDVYVFADLDDAVAFEATLDAGRGVTSSGSACQRTEEAVCDHAVALKLIAAECEASDEAERASLESNTPVATWAWRRGEGAPYPENLCAVEYVCYASDSEEGDDQRPTKIVLWVGLHPDNGSVNVDAGRERLEAEGWQITGWGAA